MFGFLKKKNSPVLPFHNQDPGYVIRGELSSVNAVYPWNESWSNSPVVVNPMHLHSAEQPEPVQIVVIETTDKVQVRSDAFEKQR